MERVIVVRHHDIDSAGFIADAFEARGAELGVHLFPHDGPQLKRWLDAHTDSNAASFGIDPDQFLADTIREEPAARDRADRLVAAFPRLSR